jgi:hypothetical protein
MSQSHFDQLKELGIDAIINLCGEYCDLHEIEADQGFDVYYLPLPDEEAPNLAELEKALEWMDEAIYLGKKVLIHCRHGIGRTGTVLNAYLLRRGLGHRLAGRTLKRLKSKPANFDQWWTVRKYGRRSGRLTIREPSLEVGHMVDLAPYFMDYEALTEHAESVVLAEGGGGSCGLDHSRCCTTPIKITLIEAVYLTQHINLILNREQRLAAIERAAEASQQERAAAAQQPDRDLCLTDAGIVCPLLVEGQCLVYDYRPLQCRTHGLDAAAAAKLWDTLAPALCKVSADLFFAFASFLPDNGLPTFSLSDVVSGRYVQTCFHAMFRPGR